ncbi:valyl-tRNA synthetase [Roseivivax halodurans JCM 10272]|uniref:Valine--tRNA ligase n=1 Tax=Roseivivax halodurans JCM 10272 TaxID=1449350 RepID=X7EHV4_9RHOB|nr:valine--tRNA ligase [Roseivivax halodurans]ETX14723.1 valyl-tRNA synthetase [Roseivivax halodurans JCM 10272]
MAMDKTFDAAEAEARLYDAWDKAGSFAAGANAQPGAETFSIMIPPPNVTGSLHMGHAFNNTLQDILVRWHRMQGHDTLWQPGQDHAGIATQMVVERKLAQEGNQGRREMGREAFLEKVWDWKQESGGTIINQLKRLGASCDWSRNAFTMSGAPQAPEGEDGNFHDAVIRVFVDLYDKGYIYRGKRLVNWDPHFETAISDLEVENVETPGHMWHFKYPLAGGATYTYVEKDEDGNVLFEEERDYISIATTRPETMLGDGAVAVHPSDERYAPIVGQLCEIPVGPKEHRRLIPIITDEYPDPDFGSGAVKITGAHDFNDYAVAKRGDIPCYRLMDTAARMRDDGASYAEAAETAMAVAKGERTLTEAEADAVNLVPDDLRGLDRFEARKAVVEQITGEGLAVMVPPTDPRLGTKPPAAPEEGGEPRDEQLVPLVETKPIMQPFGDRSKVVIEPMLTDQWFVDTTQIVGPALDAVRDGTVEILPERDKKVYFHWLENIEPWCISRQLWWGHQIPVWYAPNPAGGSEWHHVCAASEAEALKKLRAMWGDDAEFRVTADETEALELFRAYLDNWTDEGAIRQAQGVKAIPVFRDPDVLDTWFSSGLWPIGTLGWPEETDALKRYFPTSVLITGFDIIFFWVARMMMMQYAVVGERPFDTVYVHALVRDEKGKKMSKSLGNVLDPLDLIDEYGADAVRFTLAAMAAMGRDLKLSKDRIAGYRNFGTKLWNACRFAEMNGVFEGHQGPSEAPKATATANAWIIGETARVREEVDAAIGAFRFNDAANTLYAFVWGIVCDWYVEFSKPLLAGDHEAVVAETKATTAWVLDRCLLMLHPFMPFITEELWGTLGSRDKMLVHGDWPQESAADLVDADAQREMTWVIALIEGVRSARAQMRVPASLKVKLLVSGLDENGRRAWQANEALITRLARIDTLEETDGFPKGTVTIPVGAATFGMPLDGVVDVAAEMGRLEKQLAKLQKEIGGLDKRLSNPKFVDSAPEDVIEETRGNLSARREEEHTLETALARLREIG